MMFNEPITLPNVGVDIRELSRPIEHGTVRGYERELALKIPTCIECRKAQNERKRIYDANSRKLVFDHYGWFCTCCGATSDLTIDHVNGDGGKQRREMGWTRSADLYRWLIKNNFPDGCQTLCRSCNASKNKHKWGCVKHDTIRLELGVRAQRWMRLENSKSELSRARLIDKWRAKLAA